MNDNDESPNVLISDRDLDDLATALIAMEDARAAWEAEQRAEQRAEQVA